MFLREKRINFSTSVEKQHALSKEISPEIFRGTLLPRKQAEVKLFRALSFLSIKGGEKPMNPLYAHCTLNRAYRGFSSLDSVLANS